MINYDESKSRYFLNTQNYRMMNTPKTLQLLLLCIGITPIFNSCIKDQNFIEESVLSPDKETILPPISTDKLIVTNIFGLVVDEEENSVENSEVQLRTIHGFQSTTTDENGNFLFIKVMVAKNNAFLKVNQVGKFEAFRNEVLVFDTGMK